MTAPTLEPQDVATRALLMPLGPDAGAMQAWLRHRVGSRLLDVIARADYGSQSGEHLAALRRIRTEGVVFAPMRGVPGEVLELISYSEPHDPAWKPGLTGEPGHLIRAFACATLIRAGAEPENSFSGENQTVMGLIASARALGPAAASAALRLLAWRALGPGGGGDERPFFALGILLLVAALRLDPDGALLNQLCAWVLAEEAWARARHWGGATAEPWLLGLTIFSFRAEDWRTAGLEILLGPPEPHPPAAQAALEEIAALLVLGYPEGQP